MFPALDPSGVDRFALLRKPDGVYLVDGRLVPVRHDSAVCLDDGQPVASVHGLDHDGVGLGCAVLGAHVEKRELELMPAAKRLDCVSDGVVVLPWGIQVVSNEQVGHGGSIHKGDDDVEI